MSTETAGRRESHIRSLVVTGTATIGGVAAGVATFQVTSGATAAQQATDQLGLVVLAVAVAVELGAMRLFGVDVGEFSTKDNLYVVFMTFSMWFVVWTILLTTQTQ